MTAFGQAQVFRVQGGMSTLLNAQGGSVEFKAPKYDGIVGLGLFDGKPELGAQARFLTHGYTVIAGDDSVPFLLPTDIFDGSHYFSARGLGAQRISADQSMYFFAGTTSTWLGTGFFNAATSNDPVSVFFYQRRLSKNLIFFSRDILSHRQTILEGLEYKPKRWLKAAIVDGVGSNQRYFASSLDAETKQLAFKSSYVVTGEMFRRVTVISPLSSEANKENVQVLYKPVSGFSITGGHENILEPLTPGGAMQQASINHVSTDFHIFNVYFGSGLFMSDASGRKAQGANVYAGTHVGRRLEVNMNWFESGPRANAGTPEQKTTIVSGTVRESISPRISLLQLVSRSAGQTMYAFGGDFTSNRLQIRADYQNVYLPFRPDRPFEQAMALNAAFRVLGPMQFTAASDVDPNGHVRYSFGLSTYLYRVRGMAVNAVSQDSFSIAKYVVQGVVVDEKGQPVEGAALHVGKELAYTDSSGHFMVRFSKSRPVSFSVAPQEFLTNALYEVVYAPSEVQAEKDSNASDVRITVRRLPSPAESPRPQPR
jgi:hypothetical protein